MEPQSGVFFISFSTPTPLYLNSLTVAPKLTSSSTNFLQIPKLQANAPNIVNKLAQDADLLQRRQVVVVDEAGFGVPHQLFNKIVEAFVGVGEEWEEGDWVVGVEVLDEYA